MRVEWDRSADAAYIYFAEPRKGCVEDTVELSDLADAGLPSLDFINLDFDREGRLVGIEVLRPQEVLPSALLDRSTVIG